MRKLLNVKTAVAGHAGLGGLPASRSLTALDEPAARMIPDPLVPSGASDSHLAVQDALAGVAHIMNDDVDRAEAELSKGNSPYHKLGRAVTSFLRATLGFEKEMMEQASARLAEAEESAAEHQRRAMRDHSTAHQSRIYPAGSEYALCHAESQLMGAVIGVLNESLTESLRGFYKLRKAFTTLQEISEAEKRYILKHNGGTTRASTDSPREMNSKDPPPYTSGTQTPVDKKLGDEDDDLDFVDADEDLDDLPTPLAYEGHLDKHFGDLHLGSAEVNSLPTGQILQAAPLPSGVSAASKTAAEEADEEVDIRKFTDDPVDLFIHAGTALCYGLLQLILSMVPPVFNRLLSLFSFKGDRNNGLRLLWSATKFKTDINGALAGLITLGFHNAAIAFCDILTANALPKERLRSLLYEMREEYPKSMLWMLEEARMLGGEHQLEKCVEITAASKPSSLKQLEALRHFERSLNLMYLHRYEECATGFLKCVDLNNWSHGLYYYIAGCCYVELYRLHNHTHNPEVGKKYQKRAEELLRTVPSHIGKKKFMARQLPFDVFVGRKLQKWEARAAHEKCDLVDAVGVSPLEEIIYFWNGYKKMRKEHLETSLERLAWSEQQESWSNEPADEACILHLLRGACYRFMGRTADTKAILEAGVLSHDLHHIKACDHADTWTLPVANYEMSVCAWVDAGGETGSKDGLRECSDWLSKVEKWESYDLDARIGMKVTTGRETLRRCGISQ